MSAVLNSQSRVGDVKILRFDKASSADYTTGISNGVMTELLLERVMMLSRK